MSTHYEDWADWAGDHPQEAEAELRAERERAEASFARVIRAGLLEPATWGAGVIVELERTQCEHEPIDNQGVCENCGDEVPGWEPDDIQIFTQFGTKEPAA